MRHDFLTTLHCPYTGLPFSLSVDLDSDGEEVNYGVVSTEATDFPIVEGILRLHVDERREPLVHHVRAGHRLDAFMLALDRGLFSGRASAMGAKTPCRRDVRSKSHRDGQSLPSRHLHGECTIDRHTRFDRA